MYILFTMSFSLNLLRYNVFQCGNNTSQ